MNTWSKKLAVGAVALATLAITPITFAQTVPSTTGAAMTTSTAAKMVTGKWYLKVTAVSGTTITGVNSANTSYTVDASSAKVMRKFGGKSSVAEVSVGDWMWVRGKHVKGSTSLTATVIRNESVMERGVITGVVQSTSATGFVLSQFGATTYTVNVSSTTAYRNNTTNTFAAPTDLMVGDSVRVSGVRDNVTMMDAADAVRLLKRTTATPAAAPMIPATQTTSS